MRVFSKFVALLAALLLLPVSPSGAQDTIAELMDSAGLRSGPTAMRDVGGWDASKTIIVRGSAEGWSWLESRFDDASFAYAESTGEALAFAPGAGAIIGFCDNELLADAPDVTWVQIQSAGADRCLSSGELFRDNLVMTNMQKMSSPVIAEHAIAMLLTLTRKLPAFADSMDEGAWHRDRRYTDGMTTVAGKTMLVIGLGGIGTEIARRGAGLGMRVVATRNSSRSGPGFVDYVGLADEMRALAGEADVIVNALPLTDGTRGLLGAEFFGAHLSKTPYFINVGRGATVDTQALLEALQAGRLAGAGLDVTDPEPLPADHALWRQPNVIITPHVSSRGGDRRRHRMLIAENLRRYLAGDALLNVVDPRLGY
jgi:phosphoglycerate dehydrogenase-like enzyme